MMEAHRTPRRAWAGALAAALALVGGCGTGAVVTPDRTTVAPSGAPPTAPATLGPVPWAQLPVTDADVRPPGSFPGAVYAGPMIPEPCASDEMQGAVMFSPGGRGTQGTVSLRDTSGSFCSVSAESVSGAVLGADGRTLDVTVVPTGARPVNPPVGPFPYEFRSTAPADPPLAPVMLVQWEGQYCGPAPATLRVGFEGTSVDLSVSGTPPPCAHDAGPNGPIVLGFVSDPSELGQPVPLDRGALSASVGLPPSMAPSATSFDFTVALTNTSGLPVSLAPCPGYAIGVSGKAHAGAPNPPGTVITGQVSENGLLNCPAAPATVLAHQRIVFDMRFVFAEAQPSIDGKTVVPDQAVTVVWEIAGVAAATGTLPVR